MLGNSGDVMVARLICSQQTGSFLGRVFRARLPRLGGAENSNIRRSNDWEQLRSSEALAYVTAFLLFKSEPQILPQLPEVSRPVSSRNITRTEPDGRPQQGRCPVGYLKAYLGHSKGAGEERDHSAQGADKLCHEDAENTPGGD
jgi:hypothetical protein